MQQNEALGKKVNYSLCLHIDVYLPKYRLFTTIQTWCFHLKKLRHLIQIFSYPITLPTYRQTESPHYPETFLKIILSVRDRDVAQKQNDCLAGTWVSSPATIQKILRCFLFDFKLMLFLPQPFSC